MSALLGIDYGGTRTKLLLVDSGTQEVLDRRSVPTGRLAALADAVREVTTDRSVSRFGLTIAGTLDPGTGVVGRSTNMPWLDGLAPAAGLAEQVGIPGVAVQDGTAMAIAEATLGAGRDARDVFVIALGTGVAGAHVVDGEVRAGAHGGAGEIGHVAVGAPHTCSCGQVGCLETLIGGGQLGRRWEQERAGAQAPASSTATARDVVMAAEAGDRAAQAVLARATDGLARAILQASALLDPGVIVVGGGLARSPRWTVHPAVEAAGRAATFHRLPEIRTAALGVWAGAYGAMLAADTAAAGSPPSDSGAAPSTRFTAS
ncbi:ROK family protein [Ruania alkalisoli]|uniref:ROK family protein n=1 Tax=Ruania alkalisoli TaxID=2779775 RepID=A0A7M1SWU8_9MICO|nr:ROK family protein [Ruania alkalisoli]QOR71507.1 ROK family protein [Ruania alkalisoli]